MLTINHIRNIHDTYLITFSSFSPPIDRISRSTASQQHKYLSPLTSAFSFITTGANIHVARASASFRRFQDMLFSRRGDPSHAHASRRPRIYL